jgi:hypothetical protein
VFATINVKDLGAMGSLRAARRRPRRVPGLRWGTTALVIPLATDGPPPLGRACFIGLWDGEDSAEAFLESDALGRRFVGGFEARLRPLRAHGAWPGVPEEVSRSRNAPHEGPVVVLGMQWLRASQLRRFQRASQPAERAAVADPAMLWGGVAVRPPFGATISVWRDTRSVVSYAYSRRRPEHPNAIDEGERESFNKRAAFVRFAPVRLEGSLDGANPFESSAVSGLVPSPTAEGVGDAAGGAAEDAGGVVLGRPVDR